MKRQGFSCAVVCSLILIGVGACHRVDEDQTATSVSGEKEVRSASTVDSLKGNAFDQGVAVSVPVPEAEQGIDNLWTLFPGEPERSFRRGREDFLSKKYRLASQNIRRSTIYVRLQSLRASGPTKGALLGAESSLRKLAKDVEEGKKNSLAQLDTTFAATQRAIARLHREKTGVALKRRKLHRAGVELQAARDSLGNAAVWTGDHVDPSLIDCLDEAGNDSRRLLEGSDGSPEVTRRILSDLGAQIDRLDKKAEVEDVRGLFAGETNFYLKEAQSKFEKRDRQGAAGNIRRAGACMAVEALGSLGDAQGVLEREIEALHKAAEKVENGLLTSSNKLQRRFASAQYALARVHHIRATRYEAQHYYRKALSALSAAVTDLEGAVLWAGKDMNGGFVRVAESVKEMSKEIREGRSVSPEEISAAVSDLRKAIESLHNLSQPTGVTPIFLSLQTDVDLHLHIGPPLLCGPHTGGCDDLAEYLRVLPDPLQIDRRRGDGERLFPKGRFRGQHQYLRRLNFH